MQVTIRRTFGSEPEILDMTWWEVVNLYKAWAEVPMQGTTPTEKPVDLPLIAFGAFDQVDAKGRGCRRGNLNPRGLWAVCYDFDDADPNVFAGILGKAKEVTSHGLFHTTWKHGLSAGARARIVMPCVEPSPQSAARDMGGHVTLEQWENFWWTCAKAIGTANDGPEHKAFESGSGLDVQTRNVERLWYLPARNMASPFPCHVEAWGT